MSLEAEDLRLEGQSVKGVMQYSDTRSAAVIIPVLKTVAVKRIVKTL
jgi:hypothetical protein